MSESQQIKNAKPLAKLLDAVRGVVERDVELGLYKPEALRLTIQARKEAVKKLADQGMSERDIATTVGVGRDTVRRDLGRKAPEFGAKGPDRDAAKAAKSANAATPKASKSDAKGIVDDADDSDSFLDDDGNFAAVDPAADAACRIRGFLYRAQQSAFGARADKLRGFVCTQDNA